MIAYKMRTRRDTEISEALGLSRGGAPRIGHKTVLVIDDDRDLCDALTIRLKQAGLGVECALDGASGSRMVRDLEPDLVILDLALPRVDGFTLLHSLRRGENPYQGPIMLLTGNRDPELYWHALQWNVARLLHKPIDHKLLVWTVQELLS